MHEKKHGEDSRSDDIINHAIRWCGVIDERRIGAYVYRSMILKH